MTRSVTVQAFRELKINGESEIRSVLQRVEKLTAKDKVFAEEVKPWSDGKHGPVIAASAATQNKDGSVTCRLIFVEGFAELLKRFDVIEEE